MKNTKSQFNHSRPADHKITKSQNHKITISQLIFTKSKTNHTQPADQPHPERGTGCDSGPTGIKKIVREVKTFESPWKKEMMRGLIAMLYPSLCWNDACHIHCRSGKKNCGPKFISTPPTQRTNEKYTHRSPKWAIN